MGNLFFLGGIPWWAVLLIAAGVLVLLGYQYTQLRRRFSLSKSIFLVALRGSVYLALILFLFNPAFLESRVTQLRRPLILLLDTSQSMSLPRDPAPQAESRIESVKTILLRGEKPLIQRLAEAYDLRIYQFGTDVNAEIPKRRRGETSVRYTADTPGRFVIECSRPCGAGHTAMRAVLIVK